MGRSVFWAEVSLGRSVLTPGLSDEGEGELPNMTDYKPQNLMECVGHVTNISASDFETGTQR